MKKNVFYYFFAALFAVTMFASCSDDDGLNEGPNPGGGTGTGEDSVSVADNFVGEYKGTLDVSVGGASTPLMYQNITISKAGNDSIDLVISNFTFAGAIELGDVTLADCQLSSEDNTTYTFHREEEMTFSNPLVGTCPVTSDVTLFGDSVVVELAIVWNGSIDVNVVYKGVKLKGTENTEAKITSFTFDSSVDANSVVISQPVINEDNTITFGVSEGADVTALVPTITVSDGATLSPAGGVATDFSDDITYTVVSEDGKTVAEYVVSIPTQMTSMKFSLDTWTNNGSYDVPETGLDTSNDGAETAISLGGLDGYPVLVEDNGYVGKAAKLVTLQASGLAALFAPIVSGSLFTGTFKTEFSNPLLSTKFGIAYDKKPLFFKGAYKYTVGSPFIDNKNGETDAMVDECSIMAVLYEMPEDNPDFTLTGEDINTSDSRVAIAQLSDGSAKADWTTFDIPFAYLDGKTYDETKSYKLAIVCSSSKNGDKYQGAVNSTLWVDELEVIGE